MSVERSNIKRVLLVISTVAIGLLAGASYANKDAASLLERYDPGQYPVVSVVDGDTIIVDMGSRTELVRLIGVDTPELHHPKEPVQCYAEEAKQFANEFLGKTAVKLVADPLDDNRDIYGRLLRYVYRPDGRMLNTELVKQGYGFAYIHFPFLKAVQMVSYQSAARKAKLGLWSYCQIEQTGRGYQTNPV